MMLAIPIVAINTATAAWPDSGRRTRRSTTTASAASAASAITNASHGASSNVTAPA